MNISNRPLIIRSISRQKTMFSFRIQFRLNKTTKKIILIKKEKFWNIYLTKTWIKNCLNLKLKSNNNRKRKEKPDDNWNLPTFITTIIIMRNKTLIINSTKHKLNFSLSRFFFFFSLFSKFSKTKKCQFSRLFFSFSLSYIIMEIK